MAIHGLLALVVYAETLGGGRTTVILIGEIGLVNHPAKNFGELWAEDCPVDPGSARYAERSAP